MPDLRYMMATEAHHTLGDLSRDEPALAIVYSESSGDYIGEWVTGIGFINVRFPKASTRALTAGEVEHYRHLYVQTAQHDPVPLVREDRNSPRIWEPTDA